jgi:acid phosphatase
MIAPFAKKRCAEHTSSRDRLCQAGRIRALRTGLVFCLLTTAAIAGCAQAGSSAAVANLFDAQRQVERYIVSGQYEADFARVAREAQAYVERRAPAVTRPAIVLDIDETSLSNWPAYKANGWARVLGGGCNLEQGPCGIRAWQELAQSRALAPTLALVTRAKALGVAVFFISGRPAALREATERNLREQGYVWDGVIVLPEGASFVSAVDFKAPERKKIAERGFTILLSMGDQDSDLKGGYAERTFKLPNPVYFLP